MLQDLCQFPVYPPCEWEMLFRVLSDRPNLLLCLFHLFPIGFDAVVSFVHFLLLSAELLDYPLLPCLLCCCLSVDRRLCDMCRCFERLYPFVVVVSSPESSHFHFAGY